jgi:hypothetical protein
MTVGLMSAVSLRFPIRNDPPLQPLLKRYDPPQPVPPH